VIGEELGQGGPARKTPVPGTEKLPPSWTKRAMTGGWEEVGSGTGVNGRKGWLISHPSIAETSTVCHKKCTSDGGE